MRNKIKGCFLLGACGDALGAPLEGLRDLKVIKEHYGDSGLSEIIEFKNAYGSGIDYPPGRITDDTTMAMTTAAAMLLTPLMPKEGLADRLRPLLWQGYLNWCVHQDDGALLRSKIDTSIQWPDLAKDFWFACGAGRGTIAALSQEKPGSVAAPLTYDCVVRGKKTTGPNAGCGGMMRVAPLAFLEGVSPAERFEIACENAAVTHGDPAAYVATGIVALYIHFAARDMNMYDTMAKTYEVLQRYVSHPAYASGVNQCLKAMNMAEKMAQSTTISLEGIDGLPAEIGYDNPFLAVPVLAQVTYALHTTDDKVERLKGAMVLSVNHSGDSDSVGAIVGNVLGARYGAAALPAEWLEKLLQRAQIEEMAERLHAAVQTDRPPVIKNHKEKGRCP